MKTLTIMVLIAVLAAGAGCRSKSNSATEKAAVEAARQWLELIDSGNYSASWKEAAVYFKNVVPEDVWIQKTTAVRKPLGRMLSRKLKRAKCMTELPGAPDGEYVVIQFVTSFENKKSAVETVTPMLDEGNWKVSGYYIK